MHSKSPFVKVEETAYGGATPHLGNATEVSSKTPRLGLKVRRFIVCDDAINGRIPIGSERKKSDLDDEQPNCITLRRLDYPWSLDQGVD
jgi:hypothetical protein